jgi:leucine-rich repeat protein SHOC2
LRELFLVENQLNSLPTSIGNLHSLTELYLNDNQIVDLPESINSLHNLTTLNLSNNQLKQYPENISNFSNLKYLVLSGNQLVSLPESISNLSKLEWLDLNGNHLKDLSILQSLPMLETVEIFGVNLPRRYWTKISEWKPYWLLDEDNTEVRHTLIEQVGYEEICSELKAISLDNWREYTLVKINGIEAIYDEDNEPIEREAMLLLKMTCPSTQHIHILRVPPEMTSAEAAITWVNHGIHPDEFAIQT